jgi:pimeloyl-ACP methyl ester carboxylesterase
MQRRTVRSGDVDLAVWDSGASDAPTVIAVHGYPDTHLLWEPVSRALSGRLRVVAYDVRGAGASSAPAQRRGYTVDRLVDDLVAVLDATVGTDGRAHLLGHDWGSVQLWAAVQQEQSDSRLTGRLASFTSISGPSLHQLGAFLRAGRSAGQLLSAAGQLVRSSYVGLFCLPVLPAVVMRAVAGRTGSNGINLYRANLVRGRGSSRAARTNIPVQLVVATRDRFLSPRIFADTGRWAEHLERVDVDAGHWSPRTHPERIAALVGDFVARTEQTARSAS